MNVFGKNTTLLACVLIVEVSNPTVGFCQAVAEIPKAEPVGYAFPKKDMLVRDKNVTSFNFLVRGAAYPLLDKLDVGYLVLAEDIDGHKRPALISFRDEVGNSTVEAGYVSEVTIRSNLGVKLQPGSFPLRQGKTYPVTAITGTSLKLAWQSSGCTQSVETARADVDFMSASEYSADVTGMLDGLKAEAAEEIRHGNWDRAVSIFQNYRGKYEEDTSAERAKLTADTRLAAKARASLEAKQLEDARKAGEEAARRQAEQYEDEQKAKGLVKYEGEWVIEGEAKRRTHTKNLAQEEEQRRAYVAEQALRSGGLSVKRFAFALRGRSVEEVTRLLGRPDDTSEGKLSIHFTYRDRVTDEYSGKRETVVVSFLNGSSFGSCDKSSYKFRQLGGEPIYFAEDVLKCLNVKISGANGATLDAAQFILSRMKDD